MAAQSTADRNARLDALSAAVTAWAQTQSTAINARVASSQAILQGRQGAQGLAQSAVQASATLVVSSLQDFLSSP